MWRRGGKKGDMNRKGKTKNERENRYFPSRNRDIVKKSEQNSLKSLPKYDLVHW